MLGRVRPACQREVDQMVNKDKNQATALAERF